MAAVFSRNFACNARAAGPPVIRLHDWRHTSATLALGQGVHPKVVQERLGDASIAVTLDIYSHAVPAMQEAAGVASPRCSSAGQGPLVGNRWQSASWAASDRPFCAQLQG